MQEAGASSQATDPQGEPVDKSGVLLPIIISL